MEKSENTQVVATRSHWVIGGVVLSAAMLPLCIVAAIFFREAGDRIMFGAAFVLFFAAMIYYLYLACTLPKRHGNEFGRCDRGAAPAEMTLFSVSPQIG